MDYNQVNLGDLIKIGLCFSCTLNTLPHATKKHHTLPTISDEVNQIPSDTPSAKKTKKSKAFHASCCTIEEDINLG